MTERVRANAARVQLALPRPKSHTTEYAGLVVCYQGGGKWTLICVNEGWSKLPEAQKAEVFRNLSFLDLIDKFKDATVLVKAHTDDEILTAYGGDDGDKST